MDSKAEQLSTQWATVREASGEAIDWIETTRQGAPRLDKEADHLILKLRQTRNTARRLGAVSSRPMTVGFFGLSQAGKSYLISTLAAGANGKLETVFGSQRLDFLTHVNPPGGGKEATGLVTRFSRTAQAGPADYPLELKLFSELEVAKILANSFFNDFNTEKVEYELDEGKLRQLIGQLSDKRSHQPVPGVGEDDVVDLWDYLGDRFKGSLKQLNAHFWPRAVALAPMLSCADRGRLFSPLWGEIPELTDIYVRFASTLAQLDHADTVYAPLEALVRSSGHGGLSQADSIMNVDMLGRLGQPGDLQIKVCARRGADLAPPVELSLAQLAALTVELVFPLVEKTREPLFEGVDLLDFPGYRGRLNVESLDDVRRQAEGGGANPVAELILRGKVAYLFERYTESQEMNVLIVCTPSHKQSDVTSVGPVLDDWIRRTQGDTAEKRARRRSGLVWAITMFDFRVADSLEKPEELLRQVWGSGGMLKMAMLERFGQYEWFQEWVAGQSFNNTFLVRKPRMKVTFIDLANGEETGITAAVAPQLELMRKTFIEDETVIEHVSEPAAAWDAMMALNDGGMGRMSGYLEEVAQQRFKLDRIREQLDELVHGLVDTRLGTWYQAEGAGETEKKKKLAQDVVDALKPRAVLIGELMERLALPAGVLRTLYLGVDDDVTAAPAPGDAAADSGAAALNLGGDLFSLGGDLDLFGGGDAAASVGESASTSGATSSDARFAQVVLSEWINHLRSIPEDGRLMAYLGFSKASVEALVDEMVTASSRLRLEDRLVAAIASGEQSGIKREQLVERQVLNARTVIADFIAWLGFVHMPLAERPDSLINAGKRLFEPPVDIPDGSLPDLPAQPINHTGGYLFDWLVGFSKLAIGNAGHSAGREITPEQNDALGVIISKFNTTRTA